MIHFHIITILPDATRSYLDESILGRAQKKKLIKISYYNPREFSRDKHKKTDAPSYGGGPGMVMVAEPILRAVERAQGKKKEAKLILFSPHGKKFTNKKAENLAQKYKDFILISGRYEGIDERVVTILKPDIVSIGDYTLTGGEIPAMVFIDAVSRQIKGVLGHEASVEERRAAGKKVYTRPKTITWKKNRYKVPDVLISGHHKNIEAFRKKSK